MKWVYYDLRNIGCNNGKNGELNGENLTQTVWKKEFAKSFKRQVNGGVVSFVASLKVVIFG